MKETFPNLIRNLEGLKSEIDFDRDGQMIELKHVHLVNETPNSYVIQLFIGRPRHMFSIIDLFQLSTTDNYLIIEYSRKTKPKMEFMPNIIPDELKKIFRYDINIEGNEMFRLLMQDITIFFGEYNYVDQTYEIHGKEYDEDDI